MGPAYLVDRPEREDATAARATAARRWLPTLLPALVAVGLTAVALADCTTVYFHFDDFLRAYEAVNLPWRDSLLTTHGGHLLIVPNFILIATYWLFGARVPAFMMTIFLAHLVNVALLFAVAQRLTGRPWIASFCAASWGTLLVHRGTVGWYAVYGQVVCVTLVLVALLLILRAPQAQAQAARRGTALLTALALLTASVSFGVGIGFAVAMPVASLLLLPTWRLRRRFIAAQVLIIPLIIVTYRALDVWNWSRYGTSPTALPPLTLGVIRGNLDLLANLIGVGAASLFANGFFRAQDYGALVGWIEVGAVAVLLLIGLCVASPARRREIAAALLLCVAAYEMIALGRFRFLQDNLYWMATQERYHYAGSLGLALAFALAVDALSARYVRRTLVGAALFGSWAVAVLVSQRLVAPPLEKWPSIRAEVEGAVRTMRWAVERAGPGADVYLENRRFNIGPYGGAAMRFPGWSALFVIFFGGDSHAGRRVYFIESDPKVRAAAVHGYYSSRMLVAPDQVTFTPGGSAAQLPPRRSDGQ